VLSRPAIFISAVSKELKSARQLVANTLQFLGYEAVWQDIFGSEQGDLREVLKRKIDETTGLIQIVGKCYGAEPPNLDEASRKSYTQFEAVYAREKGKKVWYLFLEDTFACDACEPEGEEMARLQSNYRQSIQGDRDLYYTLASKDALEASVLKLRNDLAKLRSSARRLMVGVLAALLVIAGMSAWMIQAQRQARHDMQVMKEEMESLARGVQSYRKTENEIREREPSQSSNEIEARTYSELAAKLHVDEKTLREKLPEFAKKLQRSPDASRIDRANAAYVAKDYAGAETEALQIANQALQTQPTDTTLAIDALQLAGWCAERQTEYSVALRRFREAEKLTDRDRAPLVWAGVQFSIAWILYNQGQYREVEGILTEVLKSQETFLGPKHRDTLTTRHSRAQALWSLGRITEARQELESVVRQRRETLGANDPDTFSSENAVAVLTDAEGNFKDAEKQHRHIIDREERALGPTHIETIKSRLNLALTIFHQGRLTDAESELQTLLLVEDRVLGPDHPFTLITRSNLGTVFHAQQKFANAEKEFCEVLSIQERVFGVEHPATLGTRSKLASVAGHQGDYQKAFGELGRIRAIQEQKLGSEHPDTLMTRETIAVMLFSKGDYVQAERDYREIISVKARVFGNEHPTTLKSIMGLANSLLQQGRNSDAESEFRGLAEMQRRILGPLHPDTIQAESRLAELRSAKQSDNTPPADPKAGSKGTRYKVQVVCPNCLSVQQVIADTGQSLRFPCWKCGTIFVY
jgi:tetratricopeptide (TPR) repeat protein